MSRQKQDGKRRKSPAHWFVSVIHIKQRLHYMPFHGPGRLARAFLQLVTNLYSKVVAGLSRYSESPSYTQSRLAEATEAFTRRVEVIHNQESCRRAREELPQV
ncbi:MAG TPA: hypothetical protein P5205_07690 [Candidatus Paceibacterota bacterium]|nr:hypothetical protein [Verrucomicrobiota bacterium]HSA10239.1 hypothetical protein [Candidatus Paceibacterota bacterium]